MVDKATIHLDPKYQKGGQFTIVAENNSPKNVYIQSATLNGKPLERSWISHAELVAGGELVLKMGPKPNPDWGQRPEDRPPATSFGECCTNSFGRVERIRFVRSSKSSLKTTVP